MKPMSLLEELQAEKAATSSKCPVARLVDSMEKLESQEFQAALAAPFTAVLLSQVLTRRGHAIGVRAIQNHRRNTCSCSGA